MISKQGELDHRGTVSGWVCMCMEVARSVLGLWDSWFWNEERSGALRTGWQASSSFIRELKVLSAKSCTIEVQPFRQTALWSDGAISLQLPLTGLPYGRQRGTQLSSPLPACDAGVVSCSALRRPQLPLETRTLITWLRSPICSTGDPQLPCPRVRLQVLSDTGSAQQESP